MKPIKYEAEKMEHVILISDDDIWYEGEYIDMRIDRKSIPDGKYAYDCRHDDDGDWITPVTIEDCVIVNFAGTFVTNTSINFPTAKYPEKPSIQLKGWRHIQSRY